MTSVSYTNITPLIAPTWSTLHIPKLQMKPPAKPLPGFKTAFAPGVRHSTGTDQDHVHIHSCSTGGIEITDENQNEGFSSFCQPASSDSCPSYLRIETSPLEYRRASRDETEAAQKRHLNALADMRDTITKDLTSKIADVDAFFRQVEQSRSPKAYWWAAAYDPLVQKLEAVIESDAGPIRSLPSAIGAPGTELGREFLSDARFPKGATLPQVVPVASRGSCYRSYIPQHWFGCTCARKLIDAAAERASGSLTLHLATGQDGSGTHDWTVTPRVRYDVTDTNGNSVAVYAVKNGLDRIEALRPAPCRSVPWHGHTWDKLDSINLEFSWDTLKASTNPIWASREGVKVRHSAAWNSMDTKDVKSDLVKRGEDVKKFFERIERSKLIRKSIADFLDSRRDPAQMRKIVEMGESPLPTVFQLAGLPYNGDGTGGPEFPSDLRNKQQISTQPAAMVDGQSR